MFNIYIEDLMDFEFWGGAWDTIYKLTEDEIFNIQEFLIEKSNKSHHLPSYEEINNLFWFGTDVIAKILGYHNWEELLSHRIYE